MSGATNSSKRIYLSKDTKENKWILSLVYEGFRIYGGRYSDEKNATGVLKALQEILKLPSEEHSIIPTEDDIKCAKKICTDHLAKTIYPRNRAPNQKKYRNSNCIYKNIHTNKYSVKIQVNNTIFSILSKTGNRDDTAKKHDALLQILIENNFLEKGCRKFCYPNIIPNQEDLEHAREVFKCTIEKQNAVNMLIKQNIEDYEASSIIGLYSNSPLTLMYENYLNNPPISSENLNGPLNEAHLPRSTSPVEFDLELDFHADNDLHDNHSKRFDIL